jgi:hypothetical protein
VTAKDWATLFISCLALFISAGAAFFGVIVQLDDLRVVIGDHPYIRIEEGEARMSGPPELTFINSGNRPASITAVRGVVSRLTGPDDKSLECQKYGELDFDKIPALIDFDTNPFVLKAGEINVVTAELKDTIPWKRRKDGILYIPKMVYQAKLGDAFLVCFSITIVTPDSYLVQWRRPVYKFVLNDSSGKEQSFEQQYLFEKEKPVVILQRTSTVLARYLH